MKKCFSIFLIFCIFLIQFDFLYAKIYVTNDNFGRFGNRLMSYTKAKWISHKYNLPFLLNEFPHCSELELYKIEKKLNKQKRITIHNEKQLNAY